MKITREIRNKLIPKENKATNSLPRFSEEIVITVPTTHAIGIIL